MAALTCPLCCNGQFLSHMELNCHIQGMIDNIDNLSCPSCKEPCEDLMDLAEHLAKECVNLGKSKKDKAAAEAAIRIKEEAQEEHSENLTPDANIKSNKTHNGIQDDPNMIYSCEMCDMTFTSVEDHLAKFHEGEEVLLETEEAEDTVDNNEALDDENSIFNGENEDEVLDDNASSVEEMPYNARKSSENCSDVLMKEETMVVDDEDDTERVEPRAAKYIIEDGKISIITEEEAAEISDQSKIINIYNCSNCKLKFPNLAHFNQHKCVLTKKVRTASSPKKKGQMLKIKEGLLYQCSFCQAAYSCLISLNDHLKSHLIEDESGMVQKKTVTMTLHSCNICNTKFPTFKQLRLHLRMHAPVKTKKVEPPVSYNVMGQCDTDVDNTAKDAKFECSVCGKEYDKRYEEVHMKSHEQNQFSCDICNRKFDCQDNLTLHIKAHSNNKKFICAYCKKPCQSYEALKEHVNKQCQQRDFECQYCGRRFSRPHEKVKHERIHTGERPHICEICGKTFRIGYCLTLHMRTHTGTRPYTCDHCGKRFKSCSVFNHHLKTHSEDRNYKCPFCPKAFKTAVQLAGHKNSHTKPFSCTECNRPFASLYAVRAHMETHTRKNNLKHECWICGASYARFFALRDHLNEVHIDADPAKNDENVMEAEVDPEATGSQSASEEVTEESQDQQSAAAESGGGSPVQVLPEETDGEVYEVHMQEDEPAEPIQENAMQVVKSW